MPPAEPRTFRNEMGRDSGVGGPMRPTLGRVDRQVLPRPKVRRLDNAEVEPTGAFLTYAGKSGSGGLDLLLDDDHTFGADANRLALIVVELTATSVTEDRVWVTFGAEQVAGSSGSTAEGAVTIPGGNDLVSIGASGSMSVFLPPDATGLRVFVAGFTPSDTTGTWSADVLYVAASTDPGV